MDTDEGLDDELTTSDVALSNLNLNVNDIFRGVDFQIANPLPSEEITLATSPFSVENDESSVEEDTKQKFKAELKKMYELLTGNFDGICQTIHDLRSDFDEYKRKMKDISPRQSGTVCKNILKEGVGEVVGDSKNVKFHYSLFVEGQDEPFDSSRFRNRMKKVKLGASSLLYGMEIAVGSMRQGELADFLIEPEFAFGKYGCPPRVPPDCTILAEIELMEWTDDDDAIDTLSVAEREKLSAQEVKKYVEKKLSLAKSLFCKEKYNAACNRYNEARLQLKIFNSDNSSDSAFEDLRFRVYKNLILCYLKLDMLEKASNNLDTLELIHPEDVKILYLRTKILFKQGNYTDALKMARKAQNFTPTNTDLMRLVVQIERCRKDYEQKSKEQARLMFSKPMTPAKNKTGHGEAKQERN